MKITFLGTSHGAPAKHRNCSAAMLEVGGGIYFIDGGAPLIEEFLKIKDETELKKVRGIFTTHSHSDHTFGILHLASLMDWFYALPLDIYMTEPDIIEAMKNLYSAAMPGHKEFDPERVRFRLVSPNFVYEDENIKLSFIPTAHMEDCGKRPCYAILIEAEGKKVLFSGDMSRGLKYRDLPEIVSKERLDLFICEMAHFSLEDVRPYLENCLAEKVYFNHVFPFSKYEEIEGAKGNFAFEMGYLNDGDVFEL